MLPKRLRPGQSLTATDQAALVRMVAGMDRGSGTGDVTVSRNNGAFIVRDNTPERIYAKITGAPTGAAYPFSEVARNEDGSYSVVEPTFGGRFGTATASPAVELAGRTDVPTDSIVELSPLPGGGGWGFAWGASVASGNWSTTNSGILTTTLQTGAGRKIVNDGTDGSLAGWQASTAAPAITGVGVGGFFSPFVGTLAPAALGTFESVQLTVRYFPASTFVAPLSTSAQYASILTSTNNVAQVFLFGSASASSAVSTVASATTVVVADGNILNGGSTYGKFGVARMSGGSPTAVTGIDRDFASGDRPIVRGGIVVGYIDSGGTSHYS